MMGDKTLNMRDEIMRVNAVKRMKIKNLNEFKRQAYEKILQERANSKEREETLMSQTTLASGSPQSHQQHLEQTTRKNFSNYINTLCLRNAKENMVEHIDETGNTTFEMITFETYRDKVSKKINHAVIESAR